MNEAERGLLMKEIRDYLPYNTAIRIREFVNFSVKLEGQAPELNMTEADSIKIRRLRYKMQQERIKKHGQAGLYKREAILDSDDEWEQVMPPHDEEELDFESIEILKNYKL